MGLFPWPKTCFQASNIDHPPALSLAIDPLTGVIAVSPDEQDQNRLAVDVGLSIRFAGLQIIQIRACCHPF